MQNKLPDHHQFDQGFLNIEGGELRLEFNPYCMEWYESGFLKVNFNGYHNVVPLKALRQVIERGFSLASTLIGSYIKARKTITNGLIIKEKYGNRKSSTFSRKEVRVIRNYLEELASNLV